MTARERYFQLGMSLSNISKGMTENGWPVDPAAQERHRVRLSREKADSEARFIELTGWQPTFRGKDRVSPCRQNKRLHGLFYNDFGVQSKPEYINKDTGELQVNRNMLEDVAREHANEKARQTARALIDFRKAAKYLETFVENLPVHDDGRLHVSWNVFGARTMRWTAEILHQMPKAQIVTKPDGSKEVTRIGLRDIMCAPEGWSIVECDKSQLELRIITLLTGDPVLTDMYARGIDVHSENAFVLMGNRKGMAREVAKTFVFCDCYGGEPDTSWKQMTPKFPSLQSPKGRQLVRDCSKKWRAAHPTIERYKEEQLARARRDGFIDCPVSGLRIEYHKGGTQGFRVDRTKVINTRVQHTGSDIINPETIKVSSKLRNGAWLSGMVHDALIVICRDEDVNYHAEMMEREMTTEIVYQKRKMVFPSEVKVGKNWQDMKEWKKAA